MSFRVQVNQVCQWFDQWTPCEQTVAMVALLRRVQSTNARFLQAVLTRQTGECLEVKRMEALANDHSFLSALNNLESKETLMKELLTHLPLLGKDPEVKAIYLSLIPKVLKYVLEHCTLVEEARQLLSYSLIHPAFTAEDRGMFSSWLQQFDQMNSTLCSGGAAGGSGAGPIAGPSSAIIDQILPGTSIGSSSHYPPTCGGSPPSGELWQQQHSSLSGSPGNYGTNYQRIRRSNSLTPPVLHSDAWTSQEELCAPKPRSLSLSSEVSPQSSLASSGSGSETHLDDPRPSFIHPGMKDVPTWLKSLRLHKYAFLFAHITYEEMLALNEHSLEHQGVTKGARHKIVLSIGKLRDRINHLKQLSDQISRDKDSLRSVLTELKWMLTTPIKPPFATASATTSSTPAPSAAQDADETGSCKSGASGGGGESTPTPIAGPSGTSSSATAAGPGSSSSSTTGSVGPIGSNRPQVSSTADEPKSSCSAGNSKADCELTTWIVHVIGKACELNPDAESEALLVSILERCLVHDAFNEKQKRVMTLWRQQHTTVRRNSVGHPHFHGHHHRSSGSPAGGSLNGSSKHGSGGGNGGRHFSPRVLNIGSQLGNSSLTSINSPWAVPGSSIHAMFMAKRPSLQDQILESARSHLSVQRTKSAPLPNFLAPGLSTSPPITQFDPIHHLTGVGAEFMGLNFPDTVPSLNLGHHDRSMGSGHHGLSGVCDNSGFGHPQPGTSSGPPPMSALDITSRLESLCLSMTEAALGLSCTNY